MDMSETEAGMDGLEPGAAEAEQEREAAEAEAAEREARARARTALAVRRAFIWVMFAALGAQILVVGFSDTRRFDPVDRVSAGYRHNLAMWELRNFFDKWVHMATAALRGDDASSDARHDLARLYFEGGQRLDRMRRQLRHAAALGPEGAELARGLQPEVDETEALRQTLTDDVEASVEAALSAAIAEEGLGVAGGIVLPPLDIRLGPPPKLLITSPRDRIHRARDALLRADVTVDDRYAIEEALLREANLSALVENIGGVATYPASIPSTRPLRWTLQTAAHEWLHHYFFFHPLGQNMFNDGDMVSLNETVANIAGKELGDRAYALMGGDGGGDALDAADGGGGSDALEPGQSGDGGDGDGASETSDAGDSGDADGGSTETSDGGGSDALEPGQSGDSSDADGGGGSDALEPAQERDGGDGGGDGDGDVDGGDEFDFAGEMRRTRQHAEALLERGMIEEAEEYMERRRQVFVANGYAIRKLNQAYFAFYGAYADTPGFVSPIGEQALRFRALHGSLADFVRAAAKIGGYDEFLAALEALEAGGGG